MEQALIPELLKYGIGGLLAAFFYVKWQKAEDRYDKLRDAFDLKTAQHYEKTLELQRQGFDSSLRVEGALANSTQVLTANTATMQGLMKVLVKTGAGSE